MFEIQRFENSFYNGSERRYQDGEELKVRVSAALGFDTQPAILRSLPKGRGFVVYLNGGRTKAVSSGDYIWTNMGWAVGH